MAIRMKSIFYGLLSALLVVVGTVAGMSASARTAEVRNVQVGYDGERTRVVIDATTDLDFSQFPLSAGGMRYVLDFDRLVWAIPGKDAGQGEGEGAGGIQRFRFAHNSPTTSRLVFDLDQPLIFDSTFTMAPGAGNKLYRIVIDFRDTDFETFKSIRPRSPSSAIVSDRSADVRLPAIGPLAPENTAEAVSRKYVVVIDPGHGGKDPGAHGIKGTWEKDVVLKAAKDLRDRLVQSGKYEVVLTRETDVFVDHDRRIEIARAAGADIFLSMHADAAGNRAVAGASVYTLSAAGDRRVERMIDEKGWSIPLEIEPTGEEAKEILEILTTRETLTKSATFANLLIPQLEEVGPILRNSHRQANFAVLLAPDVPAVLLEVGFLTNPNDENRLNSDIGIARAMAAVKKSIDLYFEQERQVMASYQSNAG